MNTDTNIALSAENMTLKAQVATLKNELEAMEKNLLKQEYEGGMAEMSAGVLHNIGNTLTPSKIAISQLLQRLNSSPLRKHINNILEPLKQAVLDCSLPESEKEKCQKIVQVLPGSIEEEYTSFIKEIEKIRDKQEHIESIIALQMRYSHLKVDLCEVSMSRIIDDAISIQSESLNKRNIELIKEVDNVPNIKIQESKFLQVLINLIKNAYEAIDLNPKGNKQIQIRCYEDRNDENDLVVIKIKDSGAGFSKGKEKQFFDFGYTSKDEGSGFGLHYCASFLNSINGDITAESEGEGCGAQFIVSVPVQ